MKMTALCLGLGSLVALLSGCDGDGSSSGGGGGAGGEGGSTTTTGECTLNNDPGGPGQYADTCVKREWVEPYLGVYSSANCELAITAPAGGPPAVFTLSITDAAIGGTYMHDWEGGSGTGNDSYYRFTTDDTFTTDAAHNFGVGKVVSDTEEHTIRFRVNDLATGTPTYTGGFSVTVSSPFSNTEADCGAFTKQP